MSPEQQRIAIAEACGLKTPFFESKEWFEDYEAEGWRTVLRNDDYKVLPDYLNDLNAMHEAEKVLTPQQQEDYSRFELPRVVGVYTANFHYVTATAAQRAEAFLKTLNLWKP